MKREIHILLNVLLAVCLVASASCCCPALNNQGGKGPLTAEETAKAIAELEDESYDITEKQAKDFAAEFEQAMAAGDAKGLSNLVDWEHLLKRATVGIDLPDDKMRELRKGMLNGVRNSGGLFGQVADNLKAGGSYELLRVQQEDGKRHALFRMNILEGGLNYHRLMLHENESGDVRVADVYMYTTGEPLSDTFRRILLPLIAHENRSFVERLSKSDQDVIKHMETMQKISQAVQTQQPQRALNLYDKLPADIKARKEMLIMRINAATMLGDEDELEAGFKKLEAKYPGDACLDLMSLDYYLTAKEFDKAMESIDRLDKAVGGDPFLDEIRDNIRAEKAISGGN